MAKDDLYYPNAVEALQKDGWTITNDPYFVRLNNINFNMDLGAERTIFNLENGKEKIVVEVKSFLGPSFMNKFHPAIGQYRNYSIVLSKVEKDRKLWLAIPDRIYKANFMNPLITEMVLINGMSIVTFDENINRIIQWIPG
jgi:hypothetical protein